MRTIIALLLLGLFTLSGCTQQAADTPSTLRVDYAYYNPVSLLLKDKGWLEQDLARDGVKVEWLLSLGSNKALELLNSESVDFGSTAGAAALIGKANGNPIRSIYVYSKPEWTALVTRKDSAIQTLADLKGKKVAATRGTDPHIFLLRALDRFGLSEKDIELVPLQHSDGKNALLRGDVDVWAGLDPYMAQAELEQGARLFFRDPELNSSGVLNVRSSFAEKYPAYVERVLTAYEQARQYALAHPEEVAAVLARDAKLSVEVARKELERTNFDSSAIGAPERAVMLAAGGVLGKAGVIKADVDVGATVSSLIEPRFVQRVLGH